MNLSSTSLDLQGVIKQFGVKAPIHQHRRQVQAQAHAPPLWRSVRKFTTNLLATLRKLVNGARLRTSTISCALRRKMHPSLIPRSGHVIRALPVPAASSPTLPPESSAKVVPTQANHSTLKLPTLLPTQRPAMTAVVHARTTRIATSGLSTLIRPRTANSATSTPSRKLRTPSKNIPTSAYITFTNLHITFTTFINI